MALNINGTTGISGVDGSASAPALTGTDSNTGINFASDTVNINTGGSTRATVDSAGRFLIGTTTDNGFKFKVSDGGGYEFALAPNDSGVNSLVNYDRSGGAYVPFMVSGSDLRFGSGGNTERMRITSDGNVGINQTNPQAKFNVTVGSNINFQVSNTNARVERSFSGGSSLDEDGMWFVDNDSTSGTYIRFWQTVGGAHQIGSISHGTSSTSYNTSSDYRLKENIVSLSDGITRLKTLKPSRFNFIGESETVDGFIAHEVTAVPESITGTKDEVAEKDAPELGLKKGDPIYQGIDQSKLVPLLTAALQEAVAKIEVLEAKVAALEAG